ncbi:MAG TPA: peptide ABC transporter ATP-binding protein [Planktothrix sp. UBA8407]|jgi:oligopeptide/dipeptide ABC transporter, ATP-binding protein, C-terminal domain|nr:peptide ABC transporter ATP-binding protein [Planktothrix sp. UBA8402]HAO09677.1 peptide ABC transporter ATP-binding protein [Planktothrix sp. UBA8407]HBK21315.1 peptide ABC transporter ATP-binding protein [Planktothrix sp. UBA10369]
MIPLLEVKNLAVKFFTLDGLVHAVNGISYQVYSGETLGIVGESGSGKSISVLSILGLIPSPPGKITQGEILFEGKNLLQFNSQQLQQIRGNEIAMIFQDPMTSLNPVLTIGKQLTESLQIHLKLTPEIAQKRAIQLLQQVGISNPEKRLKNYPHEFSGGMRQRVMIAMGLGCQPKLLIADEPTTALDVTVQAQVVELVKQLKNEQGMSVIWITHDLALLAGLADRILVMYAGQIVELATVYQLYKNPHHPYTIGLLESLPRLDQIRQEPLKAIQGNPPNLIDYPPGCPFAPRCRFAIEHCFQENPMLELIEPHHQVACWVLA